MMKLFAHHWNLGNSEIIFMIAIAGKTTGPNGLKFLEKTLRSGLTWVNLKYRLKKKNFLQKSIFF